MKVSIVTVCLNPDDRLIRCISSVDQQIYSGCVEHIIKDGCSENVSTLKRIKQSKKRKIIREPDIGIYDAMNQGLKYVNGEIVLFLNSDDYLSDETVLDCVVREFLKGADIVSGNINFLDSEDKITRRWNMVGNYKHNKNMQYPHPSFFVKTKLLRNLPTAFDPSLKIASDYKQQIQLFKIPNIQHVHLNKTLTNMAIGGTSTKSFSNITKGWRECLLVYQACGVKFPLFTLIKKVLMKKIYDKTK